VSAIRGMHIHGIKQRKRRGIRTEQRVVTASLTCNVENLEGVRYIGRDRFGKSGRKNGRSEHVRDPGAKRRGEEKGLFLC